MNDADFFYKALAPRVSEAIAHLDFEDAYKSTPERSALIMDGSAFGPHFRVLFTNEQDELFRSARPEDYDGIAWDWDKALDRLKEDRLDGAGPEGITYDFDEHDGMLFVVAYDSITGERMDGQDDDDDD